MQLDRVTITGADDSVRPLELEAISRDFHFVEWGILVGTQIGVRRFPSEHWFNEFARLATDNRLCVSAHLCGRWVRELMRDSTLTFWQAHPRLAYAAQRLQLNFHGRQVNPVLRDLCEELGNYPHQFIFQVDGTNDHLASNAHDEGADAVPLYDLSGGAGVLPESWPGQMKGIYSGYAGGLGPDNLADQLPLIAAAADGEPFWIDMETRASVQRTTDSSIWRRCDGAWRFAHRSSSRRPQRHRGSFDASLGPADRPRQGKKPCVCPRYTVRSTAKRWHLSRGWFVGLGPRYTAGDSSSRSPTGGDTCLPVRAKWCEATRARREGEVTLNRSPRDTCEMKSGVTARRDEHF